MTDAPQSYSAGSEQLVAAAFRHAEGITAQLAKTDWKPSRAHLEQARNSIRKLANMLSGHGCKRAGGFRDSSCCEPCDCHVTLAFTPQPVDVAQGAQVPEKPNAWEMLGKDGRWLLMPHDWQESECIAGYTYRPLYARATPQPASYWRGMYTDLLKRVDAGEFRDSAYAGNDPVAAERARCIAICESWVGTFQDVEIKYTAPREYAIDAINDIVDLIRSGHTPAVSSTSRGGSDAERV